MPKTLTAFAVSALVTLGLVSCGATQHAKPKPFAVEKVVQPHVLPNPVPQPGQHMPAAIVPVVAPQKDRAVATQQHAAVVSHVALKVKPHVAGAKLHFSGDTSTATVEQFDSVTIGTVPSWAHYVAGYTNGNYQTYRQMLGRWPVVVGISVHQNHQDGGADCLDMEPGNPGPTAAGPWVTWQLTQGNTRPCVYSMLSWFPQIDANLRAWGIARSQVREWDANWTYSRHLDSGFDCTQWTDRAYGLNLDESTCLTSFYGAPKPPPDPYAILLKTKFVFWHDHASEYNTVKTWYASKCENPVRRTVCRTTRAHLILLRDRLWHVATVDHICISVATCGPIDWKFAHRGARLQLLEKPIGSWTAER